MVKQFGLPIDCSIAIFIDFLFSEEKEWIGKLDAMMEVVFSISFSMVTQGQTHFLVWYDQRKDLLIRQRIEKEEDLYETLAALFQCEIHGIERSVVSYHDAACSNEQYTNIFYVAPKYFEEIENELSRTRKSAWARMIIVSEGDVEEKGGYETGLTCSYVHIGQFTQELPALIMEWRGR